ncbi:MAG: metallophosphoesterase [Pseudomonadota bacterium]
MVMLPDARTPDGLRIYAIGDVHGCFELLEEVHGWIDADLERVQPADWRIIHLGDYIDRGPKPAEVLEFLIERSDNPRVLSLRGNHDHYLIDFIDDPQTPYLDRWLTYGGAETFGGYEIDPGLSAVPVYDPMRAEIHDAVLEAVPPEHVEFLRRCSQSLRFGDYFFAHAGVKPSVALEHQAKWELMWMREPFLSSDADFGAVVVHGHTISELPQIRRNRIGIDTGAVFTGRLTCLVLDGAERGLLNGLGVSKLPQPS